jgi:hypothetical protein
MDQSPTSTAPDPGLAILDREPGRFLFAAWQNVSILVWVAQADAAAVSRLKAALAGFIAEHPGGRSCVTVVGAGVPLPTDDEARARFVELLKRSAGHLACLAVVAEGKGFERSGLLGFHTNLRMAAAEPSEFGFLGSVEELARWLPPRHRKTGTALPPEELAAAVRRAIDEAHRG